MKVNSVLTGFLQHCNNLRLIIVFPCEKTTKALHTKGWFSKRLAVNSRAIMTFFGTIIIIKLVVIKDYGRFPFDQNLRCEFPGMSMGEWYRLSSVENDKPHSFIRLEFFNDFEV